MAETENLNKENFWDDLYKRFPEGTQVFCDWIDAYKERVGWRRLFGNGVIGGNDSIKFHDVPYEFQLGIWLQFVTERGGCQYEIEDLFSYDLSEDITKYVENILQPEAVFLAPLNQ